MPWRTFAPGALVRPISVQGADGWTELFVDDDSEMAAAPVDPGSRPGRAVYRSALRAVRDAPLLDGLARDYYRRLARNEVEQHADEADPRRLGELVEAGADQIAWFTRKYGPSDEDATRWAT